MTSKTMKILKIIFIFTVGLILTPLILWISLAIGGGGDPQRYLALARASCLLSGSAGLMLGTLFAWPRMILCSLLLLAAGLASFCYRVF